MIAGILLVAGLVSIAWGSLQAYAGGMSDAPELGDHETTSGCIWAGIGLAATIASILIMVL